MRIHLKKVLQCKFPHFTSDWSLHTPPILLPPVSPSLCPSHPTVPPHACFHSRLCLTAPCSFGLPSLSICVPVSVSSHGPQRLERPLTNCPTTPSLPPCPFPPPPHGPPTQATLAHCCPDGSEQGRAEGPGTSRGLAWAARPNLDDRLGCLYNSVHPPQQ